MWGTQWVCFSCDGADVGPGLLRRRTDELTSLSGSEMDSTALVGGAGWEGGEGRPMVGRPSPQTAVPTHPALSFHPDPWRWFLGKQVAPRQMVVFSLGPRGIKAIAPAPGGMPVSSVSAPSSVGSVPRPMMQPLQERAWEHRVLSPWHSQTFSRAQVWKTPYKRHFHSIWPFI